MSGVDDLLGVPNITNNSGSGNSSDAMEDVMKEPWLRGLLILLYGLIFLLGVTGNALVVFVVVRNKTMQSITNIFITNLAVSDIMMCLLAVPFTPLSGLLNSWVFGQTLCHLVPMTLGVSVHVSTLTSMAIAIDRYFVIVHPFKPRMKTFICILLIMCIWIVSISISLPLAIYQQLSNKDNVTNCMESWPNAKARQFFTVTSLILQYIVPCAIITFAYAKVCLVLRIRARTKIGCGTKNRERDELEIKRKRRTNKMLIAMVSIFVGCWLPLNVTHLTLDYYSEAGKWNYFLLIFFAAHVIAMSSTVYNPFLYAWMNENFKKEFKMVVPCLFGRRRQGSCRLNGTPSQYTTVETQNTTMANRSPPKERNGCTTESKALYDADTEQVVLQVGANDD